MNFSMASLSAVVSEEFVCNTGQDEMLKTLECRGLHASKVYQGGMQFWGSFHFLSCSRGHERKGDLLSDVLMCKEVWPFSGEGNEQIARILLGNEDEPYNFFVEYTDVCACPWKYCEEDVP
ncbi:hypothetical protein V6N12_010467 [Hibiscus sabdariffa]|uniref:Uncharacterized protein n=1 Tax=Hibiscus sabdariffa TaxID=183260 RepID=A0ABR2ELU5_9ROSI